MNIQKRNEIKKIRLNIKQVLHYQVRQEKFFFSLRIREDIKQMRIKIISFCLTFFFRNKRNHVRVRNEYNT